ncbi:MAG: hypothetical protein IPI19_16000 [Ignavibacteriales bacterium]|nr:hypothetical protein [Ignavibacteriales bacterium]
MIRFALSYRGSLLEDDSFNARNIVLFPLKYSKEEIQNVNSLFSNGLTLLSNDATEQKFKMLHKAVLFIYQHIRSFPQKSALIIFR